MSIKTVRSPETDSKKPIACPHYLGLGYSWDHLVKDLDIFAKESDIYSGATLKTLYQDYGDDSAFPLVHKFTLYLDSYHDDDSESLEDSEDSVDSDDAIHANIGAFVCWVKQVLPKVDEIWLILDSYFDLHDHHDHHCSYFLSKLYQLGTRVAYRCVSTRDVLAGLCLDEIRNLASLDFRDEPGRSNSSEQCVQLARQNAQTLQFLSLVSDQFSDLTSLIQNPDGSNVVYPCLLQYPFGDDTFFRGNSATLEIVAMRMDSFTVSILCQFSAFSPTSHPKLRCVKWKERKGLVPDSFATNEEKTRFVLSIGPRAPVREISGISSSDGLLSVLSLPGDHTSIQVLLIPTIDLDLWQAISLIKALPLLSDLHAPLPIFESLPNGVTWFNISEHLVSTYAPMGRRFRCWHLELCSARSFTVDVWCVLLLALICPNFDYVSNHPSQRESFMEYLERAIDLDRFRPYAPRLCRLLFKGWRDC
ncbi:hypothetical protein GGI10_002729 [Coemansia sp. RSA 2530]|nr:hypothetical protein GGI10_002729 [Coemansia sp. RSA 2530]